jgi:hypothetical protein
VATVGTFCAGVAVSLRGDAAAAVGRARWLGSGASATGGESGVDATLASPPLALALAADVGAAVGAGSAPAIATTEASGVASPAADERSSTRADASRRALMCNVAINTAPTTAAAPAARPTRRIAERRGGTSCRVRAPVVDFVITASALLNDDDDGLAVGTRLITCGTEYELLEMSRMRVSMTWLSAFRSSVKRSATH